MNLQRKIKIMFVIILALGFMLMHTVIYSQVVRGQIVRNTPIGAQPIGFIPVTLFINNIRSAPSYSAPNGMFQFINVPPGAYVLEIWLNGINLPASRLNIMVYPRPYNDIPPIVFQ